MITLYDPAQPASLLITARQAWGFNYYEQRAATLGGKPAVQVDFRRGDDAPPKVPTRVWLPWTALTGVGALSIDLYCTGSGARFYLDCLDGDGWGLRFNLGVDQSAGWRTFGYDPRDIASAWGECNGKREPEGPLQPVALVIEDIENSGAWSVGLGPITAQAEVAEAPPLADDIACRLDPATLALDVLCGERTLLRGFGPAGMLAGPAPPDKRTLRLRNAARAGLNEARGELFAPGGAIPCEVSLQQVSGQTWRMHYTLRFPEGLSCERLDLAGRLSFRDAQGLACGGNGDSLIALAGVPSAEVALAEPPIWEALTLRGDGLRLRLRADAPALKTLRLVDLRPDEQTPAYAVEAVAARDEQFAAGTELKLFVQIEA